MSQFVLILHLEKCRKSTPVINVTTAMRTLIKYYITKEHIACVLLICLKIFSIITLLNIYITPVHDKLIRKTQIEKETSYRQNIIPASKRAEFKNQRAPKCITKSVTFGIKY